MASCSGPCDRLATLVNSTQKLYTCWSAARVQLNAALVDIYNELCTDRCTQPASPETPVSSFNFLFGDEGTPFCSCPILTVFRGCEIWRRVNQPGCDWIQVNEFPAFSIVHDSTPDQLHGIQNQYPGADSLVDSERPYANITNNPSYFRTMNAEIDYSANMALYVPNAPGDGRLSDLQFTVKINASSYNPKLHVSYDDNAANVVGAASANGRHSVQDVVEVPPGGGLVLSHKAQFIQNMAGLVYLVCTSGSIRVVGVSR